MKVDMGGLDRTLRVVLGLVLIALAATGTVGAWGWIGLVPLATGAIGACPLYSISASPLAPGHRPPASSALYSTEAWRASSPQRGATARAD